METKKCPYCAEEIKIEAIKCKHCGEFLETESSSENHKEGIWICKKCKEEVEDSYDTCWNCGASRDGKLDKEKETEFKEIKKEVGRPYSSGTGNIILLIFIFAAIGFGVGYFIYGNILGQNIPISEIFSGSSHGLEEIFISPVRQRIIISIIIGGIIGGIIGSYTNKKK